MSTLGSVSGTVHLTIEGNSVVGTEGDGTDFGNVYGGGEESDVYSDTSVIIKDNTVVHGNVYGGGNQGSVGGSSHVRLCDDCSF